MKKLIKSLIIVSIVALALACDISGVEVGRITMSFSVDSKSPLIGEKIYIIYEDEYSGKIFEQHIINQYNSITWYGNSSSTNYSSNTAMYEFHVRFGEENKYNTTNQNYIVFSFAPESSESEDHDRREVRVLRTNHEDITANFDVNYEYSKW